MACSTNDVCAVASDEMDPAPANLSRTNPSPRRGGAMRSVLRRKPDIPHWSWAGPSNAEKLWALWAVVWEGLGRSGEVWVLRGTAKEKQTERQWSEPSRWLGAPFPRWRHRVAAVAHGSPPEKLPGLKRSRESNIREVYFKTKRHQNPKTGRPKRCKVTKSEENWHEKKKLWQYTATPSTHGFSQHLPAFKQSSPNKRQSTNHESNLGKTSYGHLWPLNKNSCLSVYCLEHLRIDVTLKFPKNLNRVNTLSPLHALRRKSLILNLTNVRVSRKQLHQASRFSRGVGDSMDSWMTYVIIHHVKFCWCVLSKKTIK